MKSILKNKAFLLFDDWVTNAKTSYPDLNFNISDSSILVTDLENTINEAIEALYKEEKKEKRKKEGFDYGYICGYVQGNLNVYWYNEYIQKQSNDYKMFAAITVLENYINLDDILKIRIAALFTEYYTTNVNIENLTTTIEPILPSKLEFLHAHSSDNPIVMALENIKMQMIKNVFNENMPNFLPELDEYFSIDEINRLLSIS